MTGLKILSGNKKNVFINCLFYDHIVVSTLFQKFYSHITDLVRTLDTYGASGDIHRWKLKLPGTVSLEKAGTLCALIG